MEGLRTPITRNYYFICAIKLDYHLILLFINKKIILVAENAQIVM